MREKRAKKNRKKLLNNRKQFLVLNNLLSN